MQKLTCDVQLREHERDEAKRESTQLRDQLREIESHNARSSVSDSSAADKLHRLRERIKELEAFKHAITTKVFTCFTQAHRLWVYILYSMKHLVYLVLVAVLLLYSIHGMRIWRIAKPS